MNMENTRNRPSPQIVLTIFGVFMLVVWAPSLLASSPRLPDRPSLHGDGGLEVMPARGTPAPVIDQLQGAGGLQQQGTQGLQRPVGEQIQPNAETDNVNRTQTVQ